MRAVKWLVVLALVLAAIPAAAQVDEKKINVNFGGGYTFALSDVSNYLGGGYNVSLGMTFNFKKSMGVQVEYGFNGLGKKEVDFPVCDTPGCPNPTNKPFYADMNMQYVDVNLVLRGGGNERMSPFLVLGGGYYYRPVKVTTPATGYVPGYCDPFWYWCYPGGWVSYDKIIGKRTTNDFGIDIGGGLSFKLGDAASLYIETRYHYIWGPSYSVTDANGKVYSGKANGKFMPIVVGIKF